MNDSMLDEYAYLLQPNGRLYTITDVEALHEWHVEKCSSHSCFVRIDESDLETDPCVAAMTNETEEGKKVARNNGKKFYAVFRRKTNEEIESSLMQLCPVYSLFNPSNSPVIEGFS